MNRAKRFWNKHCDLTMKQVKLRSGNIAALNRLTFVLNKVPGSSKREPRSWRERERESSVNLLTRYKTTLQSWALLYPGSRAEKTRESGDKTLNNLVTRGIIIRRESSVFNIPEWDAVHSRGERRWQGGEKGGREERERVVSQWSFYKSDYW